ncbi:MAG: hypothetical protein IJU65_10035 [Desulfovibrio sp.]|nr:hypothetical protein [Desulfovibrio sp.]
MAHKGGNFGKILDIDLTSGKVNTKTFDETLARKFLGGTGLATYYLYTEVPKGTDPMSPGNILIFASGPLCGTECPGNRLSVNFKSPISGGLGNAYVGGGVSSELKFAGWDMVIIRGKAPKLSYIYVHDDKVEIRDAAALAGKDTYETEEMMKEELKDPDAKCLVIGPAGEKLVPIACIISERFKAAARLGSGAVMGSKNLKGFAVRGTGFVPVAQPEAFHAAADDALAQNALNDRAPGFRQFGTAVSLDQNGWYADTLATRNYQTAYYPDVANMGGEEATRTFWQKHAACPGCQIHCMKFGVLRGVEKFEGLIAEGPEYESGVMEGSNIGMSALEESIPLIELCDALGIDNIGAGNAVSFTMELMQRGILKAADLDGIDAQFGNFDAAYQLFEAIGLKKGKAGELLGKGPWAMAQEIGGDASKYLCAARKQGVAAWDPRTSRGMLVTYALGPRGGVHTDGGSAKGIADRVVSSSCCLCYFIHGTWGAKTNSNIMTMLNTLCGYNINDAEFETLGKRIITLQRAYSHREAGDNRESDMPYARVYEALPDGPKAGAKWTPEEVKKAQDEYYAYFGWDDNGVPTEACLKKLGLDFCMDSIKG